MYNQFILNPRTGRVALIFRGRHCGKNRENRGRKTKIVKMPLIFVVDTGRSLLWNLLVFNVFCVLRGSFRNVEFSFLRWDKNQTKIIFRVKEQQIGHKLLLERETF